MKLRMLFFRPGWMLPLLWFVAMPMQGVAQTQLAVLELNKPVKSPAVAKKSTTKSSKKMEWCTSMSKARLNQRAKPYQANIDQYAKRYRVDGALVKAVIAIESCYNPTALSPKGAQGLMQLIPATAERFGISNSLNSKQNIRGGTRYLSWLIKRFDGDWQKALAGYNAGEGAVDKYNGIPPYKETQHYVKNVLAVYRRLSDKPVMSITTAPTATPVVSAPATSSVPQTQPQGVKRTASGRVSAQYAASAAKPARPTKPGRSGWQINKARAPHLYKK